jgi:hypothetical protein
MKKTFFSVSVIIGLMTSCNNQNNRQEIQQTEPIVGVKEIRADTSFTINEETGEPMMVIEEKVVIVKRDTFHSMDEKTGFFNMVVVETIISE